MNEMLTVKCISYAHNGTVIEKTRREAHRVSVHMLVERKELIEIFVSHLSGTSNLPVSLENHGNQEVKIALLAMAYVPRGEGELLPAGCDVPAPLLGEIFFIATYPAEV